MINLTEVSDKKYRQLKKEMKLNGNYKIHHDHLLKILAVCYELLDICLIDIRADGVTESTLNGSKSHPSAIVMNNMISQIKGYSDILGLTLEKDVRTKKEPVKKTLSAVLSMQKVN